MLKTHFLFINIITSAFFWLLVSWSIFLQAFTLTLAESFYFSVLLDIFFKSKLSVSSLIWLSSFHLEITKLFAYGSNIWFCVFYLPDIFVSVFVLFWLPLDNPLFFSILGTYIFHINYLLSYEIFIFKYITVLTETKYFSLLAKYRNTLECFNIYMYFNHTVFIPN